MAASVSEACSLISWSFCSAGWEDTEERGHGDVCHCPCHSDLHHDRPSDFEEDHFLTDIAISFLWLMDGIPHPCSSTPYSRGLHSALHIGNAAVRLNSAIRLTDLKMVLLPISIMAGPATVLSPRHNFLQCCRCRDVIFIHASFFGRKNVKSCVWHISPSWLSWSNQVRFVYASV